MIGEICGNYRLTKKLGEGGTGETFLAEHRESGQKAAVKVLFPTLCQDAEQVARFLAEVKSAGMINHVGVADLYESGVHANGRVYVAQEFLEGRTLTDFLIELGAVTDMESFADIGWQVATILATAHASKIVHAGLKPDSLFLSFPAAQAPRPLIKLLDFGMSKFSLSVRHSQTGSLLGAPLYMSPEIGRGLGNVDHRADIYSLGCILFEMACGRPPFVREGKGELIVAHVSAPAPFVSSLEPSIPSAIDRLIGQMLTKNPAARPQSMVEVASVLEKFFKCPAPGVGAIAAPGVGAIAAPVVPSVAAPRIVPSTSSAPVPVVAPMREPESTPAFAKTEYAVSPRAAVPSRRHDPTALLNSDAPIATDGPQPVWLARARQRTTLLEPGSFPVAIERPSQPWGSEDSRPSRRRASEDSRAYASKRRPSQSGATSLTVDAKPPLGGINVPVVVLSAAAVLLVGAAVLFFATRRPSREPVRDDSTRMPPAGESSKPEQQEAFDEKPALAKPAQAAPEIAPSSPPPPEPPPRKTGNRPAGEHASHSVKPAEPASSAPKPPSKAKHW